MVRVENGSPFLAVDGNCSYWAGGVWADDALSRDRPIRTGALTSSEAAALEQAVSLGEMSLLRDCGRQVAGASDATPRVIAVQIGAAQCDYEGLGFDAAWSAVAAVARTLWARGTAIVDGDLRVSAVASGAPPRPALYAWPLETPLSDLLLDPGKDGTNLFMAGVSRLVTDPESTRRLRTLREQYLADRDAQPGLYANWDGLTTTDGISVATVYFRDAIPYENAQGLLSF